MNHCRIHSAQLNRGDLVKGKLFPHPSNSPLPNIDVNPPFTPYYTYIILPHHLSMYYVPCLNHISNMAGIMLATCH